MDEWNKAVEEAWLSGAPYLSPAEVVKISTLVWRDVRTKYILFNFHNHEIDGLQEAYVSSHDTLEEAKQAIYESEYFQWCHNAEVITIEDGKIVIVAMGSRHIRTEEWGWSDDMHVVIG